MAALSPIQLTSMASSAPSILPDLPPISALFLINFDVKAGYTIVWKQTIPGVELEGVVEYKSLPSGLHTVHDDLIYFVHGGHAGLSAFINIPVDEEESRHARMISVGVLVPLTYGRLGRAWRHAESLKNMAETLAVDRKQISLLEAYWERTRAKDLSKNPPEPAQDLSPIASPAVVFESVRTAKDHKRNRSHSDGAALLSPGHKLSSFHPAWSLRSLLDTFGPLIFPIHRAALLRKRILISCHAPVHQICNFVYDISVLSNIPLAVSDVLPPQAPSHRLRPLFAIGVHDIPFLQEDYAASKRAADDSSAVPAEESVGGWIACTTDSILAMKDTLWDMLITMPPSQTSGATANPKDKVWPQVECPAGVPVKATQRDLRRFRALKLGLARISPASAFSPATPRTPSSTFMSSAEANWETVGVSPDATEKIVEPTTWTALAYNGFMWWASAGEKARSDQADEAAHDASLLADLVKTQSMPAHPTSTAYPPLHSPSALPRSSCTYSSSLSQASTVRPRPLVNSQPTVMLDSVSSLTARPVVGDLGDNDESQARRELAIIAYFHRLTTSILRVLSELADNAAMEEEEELGQANGGLYSDAPPTDGEDEDGDGEETDVLLRSRRIAAVDDAEEEEIGDMGKVRVDSEAFRRMGLDVWSQSDAAFVAAAVARYFNRETLVEGKGIEVCGIRIC